jgi:hypothetical protein
MVADANIFWSGYELKQNKFLAVWLPLGPISFTSSTG